MDIVIDFVEAMQKKFGHAEAFRRVCGFMTAYLGLFTLPSVAADALEVATRFQRSQASAEQLERARIRCWESLDAKSASTDFSQPDICAIRAAICFLYAEPPSEDVAELLSWFLTLVAKMDASEGVPDSTSFLQTYFSGLQ
ncbi:hypothetical protein HBDW_30120 [Herbaspirillum sp. DW155]|uniref:hypothetical protein n=1 Tax=Herbaspirillum sp. DW155 TaxID=3095609 RepID=UPI003084FEDD|nr:hypothetical protein HBDW_30120 [Herbaspirillum sp. DW155]